MTCTVISSPSPSTSPSPMLSASTEDAAASEQRRTLEQATSISRRDKDVVHSRASSNTTPDNRNQCYVHMHPMLHHQQQVLHQHQHQHARTRQQKVFFSRERRPPMHKRRRIKQEQQRCQRIREENQRLYQLVRWNGEIANALLSASSSDPYRAAAHNNTNCNIQYGITSSAPITTTSATGFTMDISTTIHFTINNNENMMMMMGASSSSSSLSSSTVPAQQSTAMTDQVYSELSQAPVMIDQQTSPSHLYRQGEYGEYGEYGGYGGYGSNTPVSFTSESSFMSQLSSIVHHPAPITPTGSSPETNLNVCLLQSSSDPHQNHQKIVIRYPASSLTDIQISRDCTFP